VAVLIVPPLDAKPFPTLGPQICDFIEERCVFGPGSLKGQPARLDAEKRAVVYRAYEVYPRGHLLAARRRFKRVAESWRKGTAKTEFAAWIAYCELHPEAPVRCDGFDRYRRPVGRPVRDPFIPMLAYTKDQTEELAFGALYVITSEGPDADLFDIQLGQIVRLDARGRADGRALAIAGSPNPADGARTTHQHIDEPHRLYLPTHLETHEIMLANMPKRPLEDPWTHYTTTAGEPGQESVAEQLHHEAELIAKGEITEPELHYFHREASPGYDMSSLEDRIAAVAEATGPVGEYAPGQFREIAKQWDRPKADKTYLERVWTNRWLASAAQAFDLTQWKEKLATLEPIPDGAFVAAGFDGARFRDSTGIVLTEISTGRQQLWATWEQRPVDVDEWEIDETEVTAAWEQVIERFDLWRCFGDPPHWTETFASWAAKWPDQFEEWWTTGTRRMAFAVRDYREGMASGAVTHVSRPDDTLDEAFDTHIGNAGRKDVNIYDDDPDNPGRRLFVLQKIHPDRKFDNAMAGCLSWQARLEAVRTGAKPRRRPAARPRRLDKPRR
jgi:hypothetical protein